MRVIYSTDPKDTIHKSIHNEIKTNNWVDKCRVIRIMGTRERNSTSLTQEI
jgi:hypothetical protein